MPKILTVKNLNVSFDEQNVLSNLNFELDKGENLAVIGPNGSGKTVLLRALLKTIPYEGEIEWAPNIHLGYVPQKIQADRHLPVNLKNLLAAKANILRLQKSEIKVVAEATRLTEKIRATPIGHLSGGQFQLALIAFALLGKPDVLLLDEPTASIDQPGEEQIYELIHELQDKYDITAIVVSHDLHFVNHYATKVLCLNKTGLCFGPPEEALTPEVLRKLYGERHKYYHHAHHDAHETNHAEN
jgi:zinc transport system ATP-binding protein